MGSCKLACSVEVILVLESSHGCSIDLEVLEPVGKCRRGRDRRYLQIYPRSARFANISEIVRALRSCDSVTGNHWTVCPSIVQSRAITGWPARLFSRSSMHPADPSNQDSRPFAVPVKREGSTWFAGRMHLAPSGIRPNPLCTHCIRYPTRGAEWTVADANFPQSNTNIFNTIDTPPV